MFVTFPLISWVRCGTWLYRFLIFALLLTFMQTKHLNILIHIWTKGEVGALWNRFKPSSKKFTDRPKVVLLLWIINMLFLSCSCYAFVRVCFINPSWSPARKGLTSWLSFVMSNCEAVTFPFVSWVRCGAWLYRFLSVDINAIFMRSLKANIINCVLNFKS